MLNWSMTDLADAARLSVSTIKRMERAEPQPVSKAARATVQQALEVAGIRFLTDAGLGRGLLMTRQGKAADGTGAGRDRSAEPLAGPREEARSAIDASQVDPTRDALRMAPAIRRCPP